jgi:hypothetical protein
MSGELSGDSVIGQNEDANYNFAYEDYALAA